MNWFFSSFLMLFEFYLSVLLPFHFDIGSWNRSLFGGFFSPFSMFTSYISDHISRTVLIYVFKLSMIRVVCANWSIVGDSLSEYYGCSMYLYYRWSDLIERVPCHIGSFFFWIRKNLLKKRKKDSIHVHKTCTSEALKLQKKNSYQSHLTRNKKRTAPKHCPTRIGCEGIKVSDNDLVFHSPQKSEHSFLSKVPTWDNEESYTE